MRRCRPRSASASWRSSRANSPSCVSAPRSSRGRCPSLSRSPVSRRTRGTAAGRTASPMDRRPAAAARGSRQQMRDVSEEMRQAASDLRRGAPQDAGASGGRALEKLRDLERRLQSGQPDERRRALGDMRLEARQLADGQRQVASELGKIPSGDAGKDALRRLAGDQARLAERMRRLQDDLKQQAATAPARQGGRPAPGRRGARRRPRDWPDSRIGCSEPPTQLRGTTPASRPPGASTAQEIARQLDRLADRLGVATGDKTTTRASCPSSWRGPQELRDKLQQVGTGPRERGPGERARRREQRAKDRRRERADRRRPAGRGRHRSDQAARGIAAPVAGREEPARGAASPGSERLAQRRWIHVRRSGDGDVGARHRVVQAGLRKVGPAEAAGDGRARTGRIRRLAKKVQAAAAKDRLAAGVEDTAPPDYRKQVDAYFRVVGRERNSDAERSTDN